MRCDGRAWLGLVVAAAAVAGAGCSHGAAYRADINSADVNERILAVRAAGVSRDQGAVPLLVDRLEDEDDAVRFYTILALDRITGTRLGFDYAQGDAERARAVSRWRRYIKDGAHLKVRQATASDPRDASSDLGS